MKKLVLFFCFFLFNTYHLFSQEGWVLINPSPTSNDLYDADFVDNNNGWIVGAGGTIIKTTDGGVNWVSQQSGTTAGLNAISFTDSLNGFCVGTNGKVLITTDGGSNWSIQTLETGLINFKDVKAIDINNIIAVGYDNSSSSNFGVILKTTDGGISWNRQITLSYVSGLNAVSFVNADNGIVAGYKLIYPLLIYWGISLKTTNGGVSWGSSDIPNPGVLSVCFSDLNNVTVTGMAGSIFHSYDGGINWVEQSSGNNQLLNSVHFINENIGTVVGTGGTILRTTNGGGNWIPQFSSTTQRLNSVFFTTFENGIVVGRGGAILRTTNGGVTFIEDEIKIPNYFVLSQNYPNPFNPSTKISWQSPVSGWQTLKVYDVLGNEVATLVNEYRPVGSYEVEFNSTIGSHQLANGIYFYRLQVGDYVETKKLILLK